MKNIARSILSVLRCFCILVSEDNESDDDNDGEEQSVDEWIVAVVIVVIHLGD